MNDPRCTLADVDQAGEELIALGRKACALHINDGVARLSFMRQVDAFVDEIVQDVVDGVISAQEGLETLWEEHEALRRRVEFYFWNGVTVAAGTTQTTLGITTTGATLGAATPFGALLVAHGSNNIYEGAANIWNGPDARPAQGLTRQFYQLILKDEHKGNIAYGTFDLGLSAGSLFRPVRKTGSLQLFRRDAINYVNAYKQAGRFSLALEAFSNYSTVSSIFFDEEDPK